MHALLSHLAGQGFTGSPRPLGVDSQGREVLTFLDGQTVGSALPWPGWAHAEETLVQVARWLRGYHTAVADFIPPPGAVWRMGGRWRPGLVIGHGDAAPYNAVWQAGRLRGFVDWDMAGPVTRDWDTASAAFSWVPLCARHSAVLVGSTGFAARPRRLHRFLTEYGWAGTADEFVTLVQARVRAQAAVVRSLAAGDDPVFARLAGQGLPDDLDTAAAELDQMTAQPASDRARPDHHRRAATVMRPDQPVLGPP